MGGVGVVGKNILNAVLGMVENGWLGSRSLEIKRNQKRGT
jgi:hypothetical protein